MPASSRASSFSLVSSRAGSPERSKSAPAKHRYTGVAGRRFVPRGEKLVRPLPAALSASRAGNRYYVPGAHLVSRPTVWCGKELAGRLTSGWSNPPWPTGFSDLEAACNGALSLFERDPGTLQHTCVVRLE